MLKKKKKPTPKAAPTGAVENAGRSIGSYFLVIVVINVLLIAGLALAALFIVDESVQAVAEESAEASLNSLVSNIEEAVKHRESLLLLLSLQPNVIAAIDRGDERGLRDVGSSYAQGIPDIQDLHIITRDRAMEGARVGRSGSFAAIDLVRRVIKSGKTTRAEVHQLDTDHPLVAIAVPVQLGDQVIGVVYANYRMDLLESLVSRFSGLGKGFIVEQVSEGHATPLLKVNAFDKKANARFRKVPGTLWQVGVQVSAIPVGTLPLAGAGLLTLLLIAGTILVIRRRLAADLDHDVGLVQQLIGRIAENRGIMSVSVRIEDTCRVVEALEKLVKTGFSTAPQQTAGAVEDALLIDSQTVSLDSAVEEEVTSVTAGELAQSIFRAYDIRGVVGDTLDTNVAQVLGQALGTMALDLGETALVVARDIRPSSDELEGGLVAGVLATGCDVINLGEVPTPLLYYATHVLDSRSGVMITGSHNPPEYNGFKIVMAGKPLADEALQDLRKTMLGGEFHRGMGTVIKKPHLVDDYVRQIADDIQLPEPRKVVVDGGNGVAGPVAVALLRELGCEVIELFCEPDGSFPNHHPDPGKPENLAALVLEVQAQEADLGIALDGDGDRIGIVDNRGEVVPADLLIMLLASDILQRNPGVDIIYDVKSSGHLAGYILSNGGRPIMWKTGHTRIKSKMEETGALLGGEFSGHICIKDRWYGFDDAAYVAARLLEILCVDDSPVASYFEDLPRGISTAELQMELIEGESFVLMEAMQRNVDFPDANIVDIDGLRLEFSAAWGLVRPSNTLPALVFRFEGNDQAALEEVQGKMRTLVESVAPGREIPF